MAYTTINKSTDYFNTKLYTGNATNPTTISGIGFQPDWVWTKLRAGGTEGHRLCDAVRGATKDIRTNATDVESTIADTLTAFTSDGFSLGADSTAGSALVNGNSNEYVSWNWRAGAGQGSSNTDGSINTTYTSVNTTSGFSISQYTGTGSAATIGHGIGVIPKMIIVKRINSTSQWSVYHESVGNDKHVILNSTAAQVTSTNYWNDTSPTASVFSIGSGTDVNASGGVYVAYCFAEKKGFSKFGSYTGNGNSGSSGTFVYTGFTPAFVILKITSGSDNWMAFTNKIGSQTDQTGGHNIHNRLLELNGDGAEGSAGSGDGLDFLANGFKIREDNANMNGNGSSYAFIAFAEEPLVSSNGLPATAK